MAEELGGVDSAELAREAVAAAVPTDLEALSPTTHLSDQIIEADRAREAAEAEAEEVEPILLPVDEFGQPVEPTEEPPAVETPPAEVVTQPATEEVPVEMDETWFALQEIGIDLGVKRTDLPAEVQPAYDKLAQAALVAAESYSGKMNELTAAQLQVQQFAEKLSEDPAKVLLTLAVTSPDAFRSAVETFEEMETDPKTKDLVLRELQAEAKLAAAQRSEDMYRNAHIQTQVKQITNATRVAAERHNVDAGLAERMVALQIQANKGAIEISTVDNIVAQLKPRNAAPATVVATPAKVAAVAAAPPTQAIAGTGTPVVESAIADQASPGLTTATHNPFMSLVKSASARIGRTGE